MANYLVKLVAKKLTANVNNDVTMTVAELEDAYLGAPSEALAA